MIYWIVRFVNNYRQYVILTILILFSLFLLSLNPSKQITTLRKGSFLIYALFNYIKTPIDEFVYYKKENEILRRENSELSQKLFELKEFEDEKEELYDLLEFKKQNPINYKTAKIILKSKDVVENKLILNKGLRDGIKLNAIVFNSKGLIGYISDLTGNYSVVHTIANHNLRISVKNERTKALGILNWDGEKFKVYNVSKSADVKEGDIFSTSEYSSLFPPDIPVIKVTYASKESETLFFDITGKALSEMEDINYCMIVEPDQNTYNLRFIRKK